VVHEDLLESPETMDRADYMPRRAADPAVYDDARWPSENRREHDELRAPLVARPEDRLSEPWVVRRVSDRGAALPGGPARGDGSRARALPVARAGRPAGCRARGARRVSRRGSGRPRVR